MELGPYTSSAVVLLLQNKPVYLVLPGAHGLPSVEDCTPWEELRETYLARLAKQRPAVA
ncbi:hypothetical protein [Streptomyces sp. IB201691-2A2]|uniref:hypothetical protein n=1 Tax=Streptomyces sp. IB201691-2A2 TaxID=2561920 RepID=UPI00163DABDA|nr:hypothetical protein [Streptomyces sp. IB201691-2A2]